MAGPARGRSRRATAFRAALPCLALIALTGTAAQAQTVTPDLFSPTRSSQLMPAEFAAAPDQCRGQRQDQRRRQRSAGSRQGRQPAPSRIGQIPRYGLPAASGASSSGYDSLNRKRQKPKYLSGPGQAEAAAGSRQPAAADVEHAAAAFDSAVADRQQDPDPAGDGRHGGGPARAQAAQDRRRSVRRGRRLRRQLPDQIGGRTLRRLRHQSAPHRRCRRARRSTWSRRNSSPSPTGSATRWSPICADRSPATATLFRRRPTARFRRRRSMSIVRISPAMSTAASTSRATRG